MQDMQRVIDHIRQAFHDTEHPGDAFCREATRAASRVSRSHRSSVSPIGRNSIRYGAMTWHDHVRCRLSVFTREEAQAIVAYLECKRDADSHGLNTEAINAALDCFWRDRAANGPTHQAIRQYRNEEAEYLRDIVRGKE